MNKPVIIGSGALIALLLSFGAGYYATPSKIKVDVQYKDKEVIKTVTVKEAATTRVVYKDRIVYPDGTIKETEKDIESSNTKESDVTETTKETQKNTESVTTKDTGLTLSGLAIVNTNDLTSHREYGLHVTKRVFSNITVGGLVTSDKKVGVSLGLSF